MDGISNWFESSLGQQVLATEERVLEQLLPGYFGYYLLQLSVQEKPLYDSSTIQHKFNLVQTAVTACPGVYESDQASSQFIGDCEHLPFEDDSVDVILLHHLQDYHTSPQSLLREAARVSRPMGQLVIIGFNPISLWGLWKPVGRLRDEFAWQGKYIYPGRLMDWMNLLNFKIDRAHYCLYGPPTSRFTSTPPDYSHGLSRNANWPFGGVYVIVARKQVGSIIPMKPAWHPGRAFGNLTAVPNAGPAAGRNLPTRNLPSGE